MNKLTVHRQQIALQLREITLSCVPKRESFEAMLQYIRSMFTQPLGDITGKEDLARKFCKSVKNKVMKKETAFVRKVYLTF
jgi:hypothetical protein